MFTKAVPAGMTRRHFMQHLAGAAALAVPAMAFANSLLAGAGRHAAEEQVGDPAVDGRRAQHDRHVGPEAGRRDRREFKPISTSADGVQISEQLPMMAKQMNHMSIVRSMSTREADHGRGRYYMHTGYVPNPNVEHPSYGSVVAHEL